VIFFPLPAVTLRLICTESGVLRHGRGRSSLRSAVVQRRKRRWVIGGATCVAVLFLWSLAATWFVVQAGSHASAGLDDVAVVHREASPHALLQGPVTASLEDAADEFDQAQASASSPILTPLRLVPIVGAQVDAARRLAGAASDGAVAAHRAVARLDDLAESPPRAGPERLAALRELADVTDDAYRTLRRIDVGSADDLAGPLADVRARTLAARYKAFAGLRKAQAASAAAVRLFEGPNRYLLVASGNAEMRAGSGMFLSGAELVVRNGRLRLGAVNPTDDLVLPERTVPVRGDLETDAGWLDPANDFRNLGLTPDFPTSAALATQMWPHTTGGHEVKGVIAVDVRGLAGLLRVTGPVDVDGVTYRADSIETQLLQDQYAASDTSPERRDRLGEVTAAVFDSLERTQWRVDVLADELWRAVVLRHLIVWSEDPKEAEAWRRAGADGSLDARSLAVSVINRGANKLDQFLATTSEVTTRRLSGGRTKVSLAIRLDNETPDGQPASVAGPNGADKVENRYDGVVSVNVPGAAAHVRLEGGEHAPGVGRDGPTRVVAALVHVSQGRSLTLDASFVLPADVTQLQLIPSARIPPMTWTLDDVAVDDHRQLLALPTG
jgi:Protein of unknown function (DUF4012)